MAIEFDGSTDYLYYAAALDNQPPVGYSIWFYPTDTIVSNQILMGQGHDAASDRYSELGVDSGNHVFVRVREVGGVNRQATSTTTFSLNTWNHAMGLFAATNSRSVLLNGGGKDTEGTIGIDPTHNNAYIGARYVNGAAGGFFKGYLACATVWNASFTDDNVIKMAEGVCTLNFKSNALLHYWPLIDAESPSIDWIRGFSMTHNGTPIAAPHPPVITFPMVPPEIGNLILPTDVNIFISPENNFVQVVTP